MVADGDSTRIINRMEVTMTNHIRFRLHQLDVLERYIELRRFACWLARQTNPDLPAWRSAVDKIDENADSNDVGRVCFLIREEKNGAACAAAIVGLRRSPIRARAILTCAACYLHEPYDAAEQAIGHAVAWYRAVMESSDDTVFAGHIEDKLDAMWSRIQNSD